MPEVATCTCSSNSPQEQHQHICNEIPQVSTSNVESIQGSQNTAGRRCQRCNTSSESLHVEIGDASSWSNRMQDIQASRRNINYARRLVQGFGLFDMWLAIWHLILLYISTIQLPPQGFTASTIWRFGVDPIAFIGLLVFAKCLLLGLESESNEKIIWRCRLWIYFQIFFLLYSLVDLLYTDYTKEIGGLKYYYGPASWVLLFIRFVAILFVKYFTSQLGTFD